MTHPSEIRDEPGTGEVPATESHEKTGGDSEAVADGSDEGAGEPVPTRDEEVGRPEDGGASTAPADVIAIEIDVAVTESDAGPAANSSSLSGSSAPAEDDPLAGPSDLDEARDTGDTGKTGDTVFVAQGAFARPEASMIGDGVSGDDEFAVPRADLRRLGLRVVPVLLLLAVIAFSAFKLVEINSRSVSAASTVGVTGGEPSTAPAVSLTDAVVEEVQDVELPPLPPRGVAIPALLEHEVEWVQPERTPLSFTRLDVGVIERKRVTVLNLWATWCKPCKGELPDLKAMFNKAEWGDSVRFASILSQDSKSPKTAHREFAAKMPSAEFFLAEVSAGDTAITDALRKKGQIDDGGLPITVVLDCRRDVRFAHQGRLGPKNFEELRGMIDTLVAELDGDFCVEKRKKTVTTRRSTSVDPKAEAGTTAAGELEEPEAIVEDGGVPAVDPFDPPSRHAAASRPKSICGDKKCSQGQESCNSCPEDCGCTANNECKKNSAGSYACVLAASALKD